MARVRVVLNRPESASNVGAAARAAANTGLDGLDLVRPCDFRTVEAWRMAWRSEDVLENARVFESLEEAVGRAVYVAGLTGRRAARVAPIPSRQMAEEIARLEENAEVAVVFGSERIGLTEEELLLCQRRVRIPSHPRQPSLNLAQAVMVAAHEIFLACSDGAPGGGAPSRATSRESELALSTFETALLEIGFLPADNPEARFVEWRELFGRAGLTPREARILLALARRVKNVGELAKRARDLI
jgi:TrmH family RNA methyltransferase